MIETTHTLRGEGFDASEEGTGRGTPLVPVAFAQNSRDEVRIQNGDGLIAGALAAEAGMKQQTYIAFTCKDYGGDAMIDLSPTLRSGGHSTSHANAGVMPAIAFHNRQDPDSSESVTHPLGAKDNGLGIAVPPAPTFGMQANIIGRQVHNGGNGLGFSEEIAPTLTKADQHGVVQPMQVRRLTPVECERLQSFPDNYTNIPWRGKPESPDGPRYKALGNSMCCNVMHWIGKRIKEAVE